MISKLSITASCALILSMMVSPGRVARANELPEFPGDGAGAGTGGGSGYYASGMNNLGLANNECVIMSGGLARIAEECLKLYEEGTKVVRESEVISEARRVAIQTAIELARKGHVAASTIIRMDFEIVNGGALIDQIGLKNILEVQNDARMDLGRVLDDFKLLFGPDGDPLFGKINFHY